MIKFATDLLKIAAGISTMWSLAAFVCALLFLLAIRNQKGKPSPLLWGILVAIVILGLTPILASVGLKFEKERNPGIYELLVSVKLRGNNTLITEAVVTSSVGIVPGRQGDVFEFKIPGNTRSAGNVEISAHVPGEALSGSATVALKDDYHPTLTVWLDYPSPVQVSGRVVNGADPLHRGIRDAQVSIPPYPEAVPTTATGSFTLPAHAGNGQTISIHVVKSGFKTKDQRQLLGDPTAAVVLFPMTPSEHH